MDVRRNLSGPFLNDVYKCFVDFGPFPSPLYVRIWRNLSLRFVRKIRQFFEPLCRCKNPVLRQAIETNDELRTVAEWHFSESICPSSALSLDGANEREYSTSPPLRVSLFVFCSRPMCLCEVIDSVLSVCALFGKADPSSSPSLSFWGKVLSDSR